MAKIQFFEEIEAWKKARVLANSIYDLTQKPRSARDFGLRDQIQRSTVSVMSNIAEGFESQSDRHFISYLFRAKASAAEVRSQIYLAFDRRYILRTEFEEAVKLALQTSRLIAGFLNYLGSARKQLKKTSRC
ncbi:MAG TPA: four helix bundle protein [Acidobacteriota bacterium]|nr:four helix bundle protein [Acidobacteriota bacterium]